MKTFLTEKEVLIVAAELLDMNQPNPDRIHEIAQRLDMVYNEVLDLFEDVEECWLKFLRRQARVYTEPPAYEYGAIICDVVDDILKAGGARTIDRSAGVIMKLEKELKGAGFSVMKHSNKIIS